MLLTREGLAGLSRGNMNVFLVKNSAYASQNAFEKVSPLPVPLQWKLESRVLSYAGFSSGLSTKG